MPDLHRYSIFKTTIQLTMKKKTKALEFIIKMQRDLATPKYIIVKKPSNENKR
jgi:hypothetical protein